ncbi:MAG: glycerol kinase GlpK [Clostridia bacterium]|nr:glycerol kinase GlpK [Clostridia bacterium]
MKWILDNVEGARERAERGELCFGTVDSWLIWKLTGGAEHKTDYSNAARTMLYNIKELKWDEELLSLFNIPRSMLPEVQPSSSVFGYTDKALFGEEIVIGGACGDQQAALFGQCATNEGDIKNTYGTGAFLLMNTGDTPHISDSGLLTTIAWGIGEEVTYAVEGSVFTCGAAIQWLRDGMKLIESAQDSEYYAKKVKGSGGVMVVPAFTGLGAPWWDPYARGIIIGITRATNKYHIIRATLESLAYQTSDVVSLMRDVTGIEVSSLCVDGGASANNLLMQFQSDILGIPIERPTCIETTALGAAYLCGLTVGVYKSTEELKENKRLEAVFQPNMENEAREANLSRWREAVKRTLGWNTSQV